MKRIEKILSTKQTPNINNVVWHNPTNNTLKIWGGNYWEVVSGPSADYQTIYHKGDAEIEPNVMNVWSTNLSTLIITKKDTADQGTYYLKITPWINLTVIFEGWGNLMWETIIPPQFKTECTYHIIIKGDCASYLEFRPDYTLMVGFITYYYPKPILPLEYNHDGDAYSSHTYNYLTETGIIGYSSLDSIARTYEDIEVVRNVPLTIDLSYIPANKLLAPPTVNGMCYVKCNPLVIYNSTYDLNNDKIIVKGDISCTLLDKEHLSSLNALGTINLYLDDMQYSQLGDPVNYLIYTPIKATKIIIHPSGFSRQYTFLSDYILGNVAANYTQEIQLLDSNALIVSSSMQNIIDRLTVCKSGLWIDHYYDEQEQWRCANYDIWLDDGTLVNWKDPDKRDIITDNFVGVYVFGTSTSNLEEERLEYTNLNVYGMLHLAKVTQKTTTPNKLNEVNIKHSFAPVVCFGVDDLTTAYINRLHLNNNVTYSNFVIEPDELFHYDFSIDTVVLPDDLQFNCILIRRNTQDGTSIQYAEYKGKKYPVNKNESGLLFILIDKSPIYLTKIS